MGTGTPDRNNQDKKYWPFYEALAIIKKPYSSQNCVNAWLLLTSVDNIFV